MSAHQVALLGVPAELMPISWPASFSSGPPELPGPSSVLLLW